MAISTVSVKVVTWEGVASVEKAASLKDELLSALDGASQVVVSVSMLDGIDLSTIQLLKSASIEASRRGKSFHLTGNVKGELCRVLSVSGFVRSPSTNAREMETELFGASATKER
ncbi:MAG: hypothetical protein A2Z99_05390 [Treponema sp. GWB1_62_6]|nr:MAG: hypothetical protein A2Y36_16085 [Treponema sp. GWA1_62_8]OHE69319.1 MAG: hypothetical protein A2001_12610 [Treponema sp. GWC1_61_84]OHE70746.1 MAG: hypothetical protein A2Z99_05390 [Treponema sp. GWB1_62_6]OHE76729.1 MAG: hypothetical protein A2413_18685 [Treponema sp. RIFOXYC1_FULL_61_9]HCM26267.1 hypothetical protein [Treponema sp.]